MEAARRQPHEHVPDLDVGRVEYLVPLHDAHGEADEVEIALRVDSRHLGRFAADQRTARGLAGADHSR